MQLALTKAKRSRRKAQEKDPFPQGRQSMCASVWASVCVPVCIGVYLHSLQIKFGSSFTFDFPRTPRALSLLKS